MLESWNILSLIQRGGPVMWPLLGVSVTTVALTFERAWFWRGVHSRREKARVRQLIAAFRNGDRSKAESLLKTPGSVYDQLARRLLEEGPDDATAIEAIEDLRTQTERFSSILSVIVTATPMLGILGTVSGIIQSFELLGGQQSVVEATDVSGGIGEALITTAGGLVVALATLFPYMIFRVQADRALGRFEAIVTAAKQGLGPTRNWSVRK